MQELADLKITSGPSQIRSEKARLVGYVYVDMAVRDPGSYVEEAKDRRINNCRDHCGTAR